MIINILDHLANPIDFLIKKNESLFKLSNLNYENKIEIAPTLVLNLICIRSPIFFNLLKIFHIFTNKSTNIYLND